MHTKSTLAFTLTYWITTGLFCLMMTASAIAYLTTESMAQSFVHLGFPSYFRVELAIAKLLGVIALLTPYTILGSFKEWAYSGFFITCISAFIAHTAVDGVLTAIPPVVALVMVSVSYICSPRPPKSGQCV